MKIALTSTHPFAQKSKCSVCGQEKYNLSDFAVAVTGSVQRLVCYECDAKDKTDEE